MLDTQIWHEEARQKEKIQWKLDNTIGRTISKETLALSQRGVLLIKNTKKTKINITAS